MSITRSPHSVTAVGFFSFTCFDQVTGYQYSLKPRTAASYLGHVAQSRRPVECAPKARGRAGVACSFTLVSIIMR
jgi:hypothetical protein